MSWSFDQPAPSLLMRLTTGDWSGEVAEVEGDLGGVSFTGVFSVEMVLSAELGVVGLGEGGILWPLVLAFLDV